MNLHPSEEAARSKTGEADECLAIADTIDFQFLHRHLALLVKSRAPQEPLFTFTQEALAQEFVTTGSRLDLQLLCPTLYLLRHGGPSHDIAACLRMSASG